MVLRFGDQNLYPNLLEQYYYLSPTHGGIIDLICSSVSGGGFEIVVNKDLLVGWIELD